MEKIKKVILSCKTKPHFEAASRMIDNYLRLSSIYSTTLKSYTTEDYIWDEYVSLIELCSSHQKITLNEIS